jgi:hypothetical protein
MRCKKTVLDPLCGRGVRSARLDPTDAADPAGDFAVN